MSCLITKPTKWHVRPVKTQISRGIRPVWSESSLCAWRKLGSLTTHWAHSKDWSDWADAKPDLSLRWAHSHFVGFVMRRLKYLWQLTSLRLFSSVFCLSSSLSSLFRLQFETLEEISVVAVRLKPLSLVPESLSLTPLILPSTTVSDLSTELFSWVLVLVCSSAASLSLSGKDSLFRSSSEACFTSSKVTPCKKWGNILMMIFWNTTCNELKIWQFNIFSNNIRQGSA